MHINIAHIAHETCHLIALLHEAQILDIALEHIHEIVEIVHVFFA